MAAPRIVFLMAVYNGAATLRAAVESMLGQTFGDFALLAVDDGSADESAEILRGYRDDRIRVVVNERNRGLPAALNLGLAAIEGAEYVARMDADDICLPQRLSVQAAFLERHPEVAVAGSWIETFSADEAGGRNVVRYPGDAEAVGAALLFRSALAHPAVMWRCSAMKDLRYEGDFRYAQDYALWLACVRLGLKMANVEEVLLRYRVHGGQLSAENERLQGEGTVIRSRFLRWFAAGSKGAVSEEELALHDALSRDRLAADAGWIERATAWLEKLAGINERRKIFGREAFLRALTGRYVALRHFAAEQGRLNMGCVSSVFSPYVRAGVML